MSFFRESDLPGIVKKISCTTHSREKLVLIVHHDGKRELYTMDSSGEPLASVTLLDEESRRLGGFLSGAVYKPKSVENLEVALDGIRIEWYKIDKDSPVIGKQMGGLGIRKKTQVSVIAILKGETFIPNPSSDYVFQEGDTCVVIGKQERFKYFLEIIR